MHFFSKFAGNFLKFYRHKKAFSRHAIILHNRQHVTHMTLVGKLWGNEKFCNILYQSPFEKERQVREIYFYTVRAFDILHKIYLTHAFVHIPHAHMRNGRISIKCKSGNQSSFYWFQMNGILQMEISVSLLLLLRSLRSNLVTSLHLEICCMKIYF